MENSKLKQHTLANSSSEISKRKALLFMGAKDQHLAPARHSFLTSEMPQHERGP